MFLSEPTSLVSEASLNKALEYSDSPEVLKQVFGDLALRPRPLDVLAQGTGIRKYFPDDTEPRQCLEITVTRGDKSFSFPFGMSIRDTKIITSGSASEVSKVRADLLYSILCVIRSESSVPPIFEDFCAEFGYDPDSRKAFSTWQDLLKFSAQASRVFTPSELESFPS